LEQIGGRLDVHSAPGEGTQTSIELLGGRLAVVHEEPAPAESTPPDPTGEHSFPRIRTMLADDHLMLREGLAGILEEHPEIELVGEAKDGYEAVSMALRTRPDVIVMDVTMPRLNGIEATRRLVSAMPGLRVIGLSMHEGDDMATAMRDAGAVAYLTKGAATDALVGVILAQSAA
jgi:CheY-like chemotaxis protein